VITWASPADAQNKEKHTRVTFDIEAAGKAVRLTITHDELEPGSEMERGITRGWPVVLSNLKTLLETKSGHGNKSPLRTRPQIMCGLNSTPGAPHAAFACGSRVVLFKLLVSEL